MKPASPDISLLIVGLGSIGQRHLKNLYHLGYRKLFAVSSGRTTMSTNNLPLQGIAATAEEAIERFRPEAVFICNPTSLHLDTATKAVQAGAHIFLEKPVSHSWKGLEHLESEVTGRGLHGYVGFQFRQHPVLQSIRNLIRKGELGVVRAVDVEWGEYLPGWHPWEDYRKSYSAREDLGGGVTFTLCHPFDYLRWMLGEPGSVSAAIRHTGGLDIPVDDIHRSVWTFPGDVTASVHLDYYQQPGVHRMTVISDNCRLDWDNRSGVAVLFDEGSEVLKISVEDEFERNHLFLAEMREFMNGIDSGDRGGCTLADGMANMRMILASKAASAQRRTIELKDWEPDANNSNE